LWPGKWPDRRRSSNGKPRFFAFDSFAGVPGGEADRQPAYDALRLRESRFGANIAAESADTARVVTLLGIYDQSLVPADRYRLRRAALIMIDCNLYECKRSCARTEART
jgi:hypothetical protein